MLLSAGVTTGWHLAQVAQQQFSGDICLHLCDINPRELVPAAALGGPFHRVLPLADPGYQQQILTLLKENHLDVIVPLIGHLGGGCAGAGRIGRALYRAAAADGPAAHR